MKKYSRETLAWYASRFASMSPREIGYRLFEAAAKRAARSIEGGWRACYPTGTLAILPEVDARTLGNLRDISALVAEEANSVRQGNFHFLGIRWPTPLTMPPPSYFWHLDPEDGELFSERNKFCFDISFRHGINIKEIKRIWEINRLQFIVPLASDAAITNDQKSRDLVIALIESWMMANPPYLGLSWVFGIELGLRVISVALALSIIGIEHLEAAARARMLQFFLAHVDWIRRFPSLYSSANNHRIAELAGLIVGTIMAPGIENATVLRENSWRELLVEIDRQIYPDGVGAEQSPGYSAFSIELFIIAAIACRRQRSLPAATRNRLSSWAEYSLWLMDADGRVPAIGDFDDCRVVATTQAPETRYVASVVGMVSECLGRKDLAPPARDPSIRDSLLGSPGVSLKKRAGIRLFPMGGYSVIRSNTGKLITLTLDHGPIGYLSIAAHGHADSLSIWLSVDNQPIIVDPGTYLYHSNKVLRKQFRETAVHNTLTLDGLSSSQVSGPFNWGRKANSYLVESETKIPGRIVAEHDGYLAQYGVRHRRAIEFDGVSRFTIIDELIGKTEHARAFVSFLLSPDCDAALEPDGRGILISAYNRSVVRIVGINLVRPRIIRADEISAAGWVSPSFGVRVPADQVLFEGNSDHPIRIIVDVL